MGAGLVLARRLVRRMGAEESRTGGGEELAERVHHAPFATAGAACGARSGTGRAAAPHCM
jgi:hypothetical protein